MYGIFCFTFPFSFFKTPAHCTITLKQHYVTTTLDLLYFILLFLEATILSYLSHFNLMHLKKFGWNNF